MPSTPPERQSGWELAAAEQQHLMQWLSKRLDKPLQLPDLTSQGYALVGGRLLPGDRGARAQFMSKDGRRASDALYRGRSAAVVMDRLWRDCVPFLVRRSGGELLLGRPRLWLCDYRRAPS